MPQNIESTLTPIGNNGPTMAAAQQHNGISNASAGNPDTEKLVDIPLHDIMPLMEVNDNSLLFLIGISVFSIMIVSLLLYLAWKFFQNRNTQNLRKEYYEALMAIDFSNAKDAAYKITELGYFFSEDSERMQKKYEHLVALLSAYKYKAHVNSIDDEVKSHYKIYVEMIDV
jgi:hypothetical protein